MKRVGILVLLALVAVSTAKSVKSKRGPLSIFKGEGSSDVVCEAPFSEELSVLKQSGTRVLVKGSCQGWVEKSAIEYIAKAAGDKGMNLDEVDIVGWLDNPSAVFVLDDASEDVDGVNLDRNFSEYLTHTLDRERIEHRNGEN